MTDRWPLALRTALRRGRPLVAEVPASRPARRAWVAIHPLPAVAAARTDQAFNLFHREFDRVHIDNDRCVGPDDGMIEVLTAHAQNETQLSDLLSEWGIEPSRFTYVHRTEYPV